MPVLIIFRFEECITERNLLNALHIDIIHKLRINVKENRHIDRLARIQPLLLEAEALDLAEILRHLSRGNTVCRNTDDVLVRGVRRRVECQRRLSGQHAHFSLLRDKFPGKDVGDGAIEGHADALCVGDGPETLTCVISYPVPCSFDGLASVAGCLADLREDISSVTNWVQSKEEDATIL